MKQLAAFLVLIFIISTDLSAQTTNDHEIGIRFNNFRDFSLVYKKHLKENKYLRLRSVSSNYSFTFLSSNLSLGVAVGREKRREINSKLQFVSGGEFGLFFNRNEWFGNSVSSPSKTFSTFVSLNAVLGLNYSVNPRFNLGVEILPGISSNVLFNDDGYVDNSFSLNIFNGWTTAALVAVYTFNGKEK